MMLQLAAGRKRDVMISSLALYFSETLGAPVEKFAPDDLRPDFGCNENCFGYVLNDIV
jgi:hypothetical protein